MLDLRDCAESVKYYAVSECNHRTRHVCALCLRALYKKLDCKVSVTSIIIDLICIVIFNQRTKEPQPTVIFTVSPDTSFASYTPNGIPLYDMNPAILFETQEILLKLTEWRSLCMYYASIFPIPPVTTSLRDGATLNCTLVVLMRNSCGAEQFASFLCTNVSVTCAQRRNLSFGSHGQDEPTLRRIQKKVCHGVLYTRYQLMPF